ncbi:MAG TPA: hypothetical protein VLZ89_13670 [Anaerolineales bacterium]|nr:hypothetical protein [Anaerolineales bacterium]
MRPKFLFPIFLIAALLGACGSGAAPGTSTPVPTSTSTPPPLQSPTPVAPLAILILPSTMDKAASDLYQKTVYDLTQQAGMHFQVRNALAPKDLPPGVKVVIALPPDPGIAALAGAAPQAQFLAVDIPEIKAGGNISVLAANNSVDIPAFLAGYTAAMITDDFQIGMILPKDNPDAQKAFAAFKNGMIFYCGLCRPFYYQNFCITNGLTYCYPQAVEIPSSEDPSRYAGYANALINNYSVNTIYVYPDVAVKSLMDYLATTGVDLIGLSTPNPAPGGWVMTIRADEVKAIQNAWPDLVAGKGGETVPAPLGIWDVNPANLSPGRQRLAQQTLDELTAGQIATGVGQ